MTKPTPTEITSRRCFYQKEKEETPTELKFGDIQYTGMTFILRGLNFQ